MECIIRQCVNKKRAMKEWKMDKELILGRKLAEDLKDGNQDCFWRRLKRGCGNQGLDVCSSRIGDAHTNSDILKLWKEHFGKVANCHSQSEKAKLQEIFMEDMKTSERIDGQKMWDSTVSLGVVKKAASKLRNKKAAGLDGISTEHIKHGGTDLLIHISVVFQAMLRHGYVPEQWKESVIVPILKNKSGSKMDPDNYRGITLSSIMSKLFERVLLMKYGHLLKTSQLQFGFTPNVGTAECSYVVQETIDHYLSNGNDFMYTCALDLSKAFDRVSYHRLMSLLVKRQVPLQVVKMIYDWYSNQTVRVRWAGWTSEAFGVSNGVRQGGVLSPIFFNIIIDELLNEVERTGYGARLAGTPVGCIAYADDITLISPTVGGIQAMLGVCESFVRNNLLKFNVEKSVVTVFRRRRLADPGNLRFVIDSGVLPVKESFCHLGSLWSERRSDVISVEKRIKKFYAAVNAVVCRLRGASREEDVWKKVLDIQLFPVLSYGSHMWDFTKISVCNMLNSAWRKAIRKGLGMGFRDSISDRLKGWFKEATEKMLREQALFLHRALYSGNAVVRGIALATQRTRSSRVWTSVRKRLGLIGLCQYRYHELKSILLN